MNQSPALTILGARLQAAAYDAAFLATGVIDLSPFSRTLRAVIWATDPGVGKVRHGHISLGGEGPVWAIAGTLMPKGSIVEWLDDLDAFLTQSPWTLGNVHRGFLTFHESMTVEMDGVELPIRDFVRAHPELCEGALVEGHSLGAPNAVYLFLEMHFSGWRPAGVFLWASPRPGDSQFRMQVIAIIQGLGAFLESYANPNDAVPNVPLTVTRPFNIWDFEPIVQPTDLQANLVSPPIAADWGSSHHMDSYLALIQAFFAGPTGTTATT